MDRRIAHELEAQLATESVDLSALDDAQSTYTHDEGRVEPLYVGLTENDLEFFVASFGVKVNRAQYVRVCQPTPPASASPPRPPPPIT